jgi:glycosyltransferase involved in cell wall biosynthesis
VLIPCFDAAAWMGEAIESALAQTHGEREVIALDDGSRDATPDVLAGFGDRIRWERGLRRGANAARNRLLALSSGDWVQFLDADDLLLPAKLAVQVRVGSESGADLVTGPWCNQRGALRGVRQSGDDWVSFLDGTLGVTSANLYRRQALVAAGGWDESRRAAQEVELTQRLLRLGARVVSVPEVLCVKRSVNPHSVWRSIWRDDPLAAREADVSAVAEAVRHLRERGELGVERERAAGARFLRMARSARSRDAGWDVVLAEAARLGLGPEALLWDQPRWYRAAYRLGGFAGAERAEALRAWLRGSQRRQRSRSPASSSGAPPGRAI